MSYCDGCHAHDPFDCGAILARHHHREDIRITATCCDSSIARYQAKQHGLLAAELEECGCTCACHADVVDQSATAEREASDGE